MTTCVPHSTHLPSGPDCLEPFNEWAWCLFANVVFTVHHSYIMTPLALVSPLPLHFLFPQCMWYVMNLSLFFFSTLPCCSFLNEAHPCESELPSMSGQCRPIQRTILQTHWTISSNSLPAVRGQSIHPDNQVHFVLIVQQMAEETVNIR